MALGNQMAVPIATLAGFFLGLLAAFDRVPDAPTLSLGEIGLGIALLGGIVGGVAR